MGGMWARKETNTWTHSFRARICLCPSPVGCMVMRWLRLSMWSAAILVIVFQAAFLLELNSPQAVDETLWYLFAVSVVCFIVFVYARSAISSLKKFKS